MQVILLEKVANLGDLGEVVKVKDGFARNFLIPQGKAKRATEAAIKEFEGRRADFEKAQSDRLAAAQTIGEKLSGKTVTVPAKAGVDGKLFGSVTSHDITTALAADGVEIAKSQLRMPEGALKALGEHKVAVALHTDVIVEVTVIVVADKS